jgi:hypothetical protein
MSSAARQQRATSPTASGGAGPGFFGVLVVVAIIVGILWAFSA